MFALPRGVEVARALVNFINFYRMRDTGVFLQTKLKNTNVTNEVLLLLSADQRNTDSVLILAEVFILSEIRYLFARKRPVENWPASTALTLFSIVTWRSNYEHQIYSKS